MTKIRSIIVEDEPLAREGLKSYIHAIGNIELCGICENALEANDLLAKEKPDLMFLDIQMPKITGLDFLKTLKSPPLVILTTAFPNYALQGFELDVVDYLVKPYPFDRFLKAVNKAKEILELRQQSPAPSESSQESDYIFIKVDNALKRINFNEVYFIEGMENYVSIFTKTERFITLMTMKRLEEVLPSKDFLRVHKTYIVAKDKVMGIIGNELDMEIRKIPISRNRRNEIIHDLTKGSSI